MGTWGLVGGNGAWKETIGAYYAEGVSSNIHSQLLMGQSELKKKVDMQRQENKKLHADLAPLQHHLWDLKPSYKDQQEETSDLQTQQQQVGTGSWVRLVSSTICPLD